MITIEQVIEQCARIVDPSAEHRQNPGDYIGEEEGMRMLDDLASEIRTLAKQYEGCIVAEGERVGDYSGLDTDDCTYSVYCISIERDEPPLGTPLYRAREAK